MSHENVIQLNASHNYLTDRSPPFEATKSADDETLNNSVFKREQRVCRYLCIGWPTQIAFDMRRAAFDVFHIQIDTLFFVLFDVNLNAA